MPFRGTKIVSENTTSQVRRIAVVLDQCPFVNFEIGTNPLHFATTGTQRIRLGTNLFVDDDNSDLVSNLAKTSAPGNLDTQAVVRVSSGVASDHLSHNQKPFHIAIHCCRATAHHGFDKPQGGPRPCCCSAIRSFCSRCMPIWNAREVCDRSNRSDLRLLCRTRVF